MSSELRFLRKLSEEYPNIDSAVARLTMLEASLKLPKGTEHFISDVHGENEAFFYVIKSASGSVRRKIEDALKDSASSEEKKELYTIICYPEKKLELINRFGGLTDDELKLMLERVIRVARLSISKYPYSFVESCLPQEYKELVMELIRGIKDDDKKDYYSQLIQTSLLMGNAEELIIVLAKLIQKLVIARLHIVGDIYDRGPGPHLIMDFLEEYDNFDCQWGNHDVVWMGAALGHGACICNILRNSLRYDELDIISNGYGINMIPLMQFAQKYYADDPCEAYAIKGRPITYDRETQITLKMHKAISIIQFKLEAEIIKENPDFNMEDRLILDKIDQENATVTIDGRVIPLKDASYPTIDPNAPFELNEDEKKLIDKLSLAFKSCEKFRRHAQLLVDKGGMYKIYNNALMFHGCQPLNEDGTFRECHLFGKTLKGKAWNDELEKYVRKAFSSDDQEDIKRGGDILWYLWNGADAPIFGKAKMATFERYLLDDKEAQKEEKDWYFKLIYGSESSKEVACNILKEFGIDPELGIIVNGHVPVKQVKGEEPVKASGKVYVIDGGFSRSYHKETGIAGYTLIRNSWTNVLVAHNAFTSTEDILANGDNLIAKEVYKHVNTDRILVKDTDAGKVIQEEVDGLKDLISAFKEGLIPENNSADIKSRW